jgi:hypothetical protein
VGISYNYEKIKFFWFENLILINMKEIYSEIEVNAPASVVWDILTDFDNYVQWNPFIKEISGNLIVGTEIEVFIKPPNSRGMRFRPKVLSYKPKED